MESAALMYETARARHEERLARSLSIYTHAAGRARSGRTHRACRVRYTLTAIAGWLTAGRRRNGVVGAPVAR